MAGELLLDTGGLVSLLDRSQARHLECVHWFDAFDGSVVSTEAVLTEATHLLGGVRGGADACIAFFLQGGATLIPSSRGSLERCGQLMAKYRDLPMDFADATLVALAEELGATQVLTLDQDFHVYRIRGRKRFEPVPPLGPRRRRR